MNKTVVLTPNQNSLTGKFRAGDIVLVECDSTTRAFSVQVPDAKTARDVIFYFKKTNSESNDITLTTSNAQTIDGESTLVISTQNTCIGLISDNENYNKVNYDALNTEYLLRDGSRELTADWDSGAYKITAQTFDADSSYYLSGTEFLAVKGTDSYCFGFGAGDSITTAANCVAIGTDALHENETAQQCFAIGYQSQYNNKGGFNYTIGNSTLYSANNSGCYANIAVGHNALYSGVTGVVYNIAFGYQTMYNGTTPSYNIAFGAFSQYNNNGAHNISFGYQSLYSGTTPANCIAIGSYSLNAAYGSNCIGIGYQALKYISSGNYMTAVGGGAFQVASTASSGVALGFQAGFWETGSNKLFIDNQHRGSEANGRVGAMIYGEFNSTVANQLLRFNAKVHLNLLTASRMIGLDASKNIVSIAPSSAYSVTNVTTDRTYDANSTTINEIADVLGTLIADLQAINILG